MSELNERFHATKVAWRANEKLEGRQAGIAFATDRAGYQDLLALRKFATLEPEYRDEGELAGSLYGCFPADAGETSYRFNERLYDDGNADPTDEFVEAFAEAALEVLEQADAEGVD